MNEAADVRARGAATAFQNGTDVPHGPGWPRAEVPEPSALPDATPPATLF